MENAIIIYASTHHGNTRKLVEAIAETYHIPLIDATQQKQADLSGYDLIGFASGIDFGRFYAPVETFLQDNLPEGKQVFFLYTCARPGNRFTQTIQAEARKKNARILGEYGCRGYNTYGPWKWIGGMNRNHPSQQELQQALHFFASLQETKKSDL